jgi:hypothetical protein
MVSKELIELSVCRIVATDECDGRGSGIVIDGVLHTQSEEETVECKEHQENDDAEDKC